MPRYVAFLRGINVGGHRVKMDRLGGLFEEMGLRDVSTFIASGNVLFSSDTAGDRELRARIEDHLERELGYAVATFLRTPVRLAEITEFGDADSGSEPPPAESRYVVFLQSPPPHSLRESLDRLASDTDAFEFDGLEIHWRIRGKLSESPLFGGELDRATRGVPTTMRNLNTLRRILARSVPP